MKAILLISGLAFLQACNCGGTNKEVGLEILYSNFLDRPHFNQVVAEGANREVALITKVENLDTFSVFRLPVNNHLDSTRYFFFRNERVDTVVIKYDRQFEFRSNDCGYSIDYENCKVSKNTLSRRAFLNLGGRFGIGGSEFVSSIEFSDW
ncbi:MAG TPA: DUF6452 family protein [Catalimonadaceae bacterium]|nr:DUF6452 family protein [Catalimonadaceae bacterium]